MSNIPATAPFTRVQIDVARDEDWFDRLPQLIDVDGSPVDLTGATLRLYVRPVYDHSVSLMTLTSGDGITIDNAASGAATISVPRTQVQSSLPLLPNGQAATYDHFLVLDQPGRTPRYREVWRGPLIVHPART